MHVCPLEPDNSPTQAAAARCLTTPGRLAALVALGATFLGLNWLIGAAIVPETVKPLVECAALLAACAGIGLVASGVRHRRRRTNREQ